MGEITRIASGAPWEPIFGYCRAVRAGGWVAVSGTTSFDEHGTIAGKNQVYVQSRQAIANIALALERVGMTLANVVRTRIFITDIARFAEVARAHQENFGANPPASTIVEVRRLVHPDMLVEIEADAYADSHTTSEAIDIVTGTVSAGAKHTNESAAPRRRVRPARTKAVKKPTSTKAAPRRR
jgi:enamine deaminase RidA (YjgF/YER057c/UK114 family)